MKYCSNCHVLVKDTCCPGCHSNLLRLPCEDDFCLLTQMQTPWSEAFTEVLSDRGIPCFTEPTRGAWMSTRLGVSFSRDRIFVPYGLLEEAQELADAFFSDRYQPWDAEAIFEE